MEKTIALNEKNIDRVIKTLRKKLAIHNEVTSSGFLFPKYYRTNEIDRNKYIGKGRPRFSDYINKKTEKILKEFIKLN